MQEWVCAILDTASFLLSKISCPDQPQQSFTHHKWQLGKPFQSFLLGEIQVVCAAGSHFGAECSLFGEIHSEHLEPWVVMPESDF